jgi:hypothetical protein
MTHQEYITEFERIAAELVDLTRRKNSDYSEGSNAFANFDLIEDVTGGRISREEGILVRMTDKLKRIGGLLRREAQVADEKITDTAKDLAVYSLILLISLQERQQG